MLARLLEGRQGYYFQPDMLANAEYRTYIAKSDDVGKVVAAFREYDTVSSNTLLGPVVFHIELSIPFYRPIFVEGSITLAMRAKKSYKKSPIAMKLFGSTGGCGALMSATAIAPTRKRSTQASVVCMLFSNLMK